MTEKGLSRTNETTRRALAMASSRPAEALSLLDAELELARESADDEAVVTLARNAGVLRSASNNLRDALANFEEACRVAPDDPYLHLAVADVRRRLSEIPEAANSLRRSLKCAQAVGDSELAAAASRALSELDRESD